MTGSDSDAILLRLRWRLAFDQWERKLGQWVEAVKAGFDPNQPRVSAGNPDGGQWTRTGGGQILSDANRDNFWRPGARIAQAKPGKPGKPPFKRPSQRHRSPKRRPSPVKKLTVPTPNAPGKVRGPLPPVPRVPMEPPPTRRLKNRIAKEVGKWLLKAGSRRALGPIGVALDVIDVALWLHDLYPDIQSYFDAPKSLQELQHAANDPLEGYEIHHIVERAIIERDGIGEHRVNSPENLVRIPAWKHHEITAWNMTKNKDYGWLSPREYLRGKSWEEKYRVGLDALKDRGVLK